MKPLITLFLAVIAGCLLIPSAQAQLNLTSGNELAMKDFTLFGNDPKGQPWQLRGQRTQMKGTTVMVDDVRLQFQLNSSGNSRGLIQSDGPKNEVKVLLESDHCQFNTATNEIKSPAALRVHLGRNIIITGIGYDIDVDKKVILIRSAVRATMTSKLQLYKRK